MPPMNPRLLRPTASGRFDPRRLANIRVWLDAADATTLFDSNTGGNQITDGVGVGRWVDKSGNGFNVTQSTSGNRPLWKVNQQGGLPGLDFDGSNDLLYGAHNTFSAAVSAFCVVSFFNNTTRYLAFDIGNNTPSPARHFGFEQNTFSTAGQRYGLLASPNAYDSNFATSSGAKQVSIIANAVSGTSVVNNITYRVGRVTGTLTLTGGTGNFSDYSAISGLMIGALNSNGAGSLFLRGVFHELIVYDRQLPASEYQAVENYLAAKWSL
jgi:hypothetical protein